MNCGAGPAREAPFSGQEGFSVPALFLTPATEPGAEHSQPAPGRGVPVSGAAGGGGEGRHGGGEAAGGPAAIALLWWLRTHPADGGGARPRPFPVPGILLPTRRHPTASFSEPPVKPTG